MDLYIRHAHKETDLSCIVQTLLQVALSLTFCYRLSFVVPKAASDTVQYNMILSRDMTRPLLHNNNLLLPRKYICCFETFHNLLKINDVKRTYTMSDNFIFLTRVTFIQVYERLSYTCIAQCKRVHEFMIHIHCIGIQRYI